MPADEDAIPSPGLDIRWHTGGRAELRHLFALAEDSAEQLDGYLHCGRVLVAIEGQAIVGHLQLVACAAADELELRNMAVVEDRRGRGIGRALVRRAVAECRAAGARTLLVATATADIGNLRFYQRMGFRMLRVQRDAFTASQGHPDVEIDGIPLRDRVWLTLSL
jgi:GNAT superfamily N-acetyltransferase